MPRISGRHISQGSMHLLYEHQRQCEHIRAVCLKGACDMPSSLCKVLDQRQAA